MVRDGMAWRFKRYSNERALAEAEREARAERRGLWADDKPVPLWELRRERKKKARTEDRDRGTAATPSRESVRGEPLAKFRPFLAGRRRRFLLPVSANNDRLSRPGRSLAEIARASAQPPCRDAYGICDARELANQFRAENEPEIRIGHSPNLP
jgi:hypothetical protein